ncbi:MAG: HDIG domain-containing metalloprotein, partial [Bacteroidota bacterium]
MKTWKSLFQRSTWTNRRFLLRNGLIILYLLVMTLILPRSFRLKFQYEIGKPWNGETLNAPFDFPIYKDADSLQSERKRIGKQVKPVFRVDSMRMKASLRNVQQRYDKFYSAWGQLQQANARGDTTQSRELLQTYFQQEFKEVNVGRIPQKSASEWQREVMEPCLAVANRIYNKGYVRMLESDTLGDFIALRTAKAEERNIPVSTLLIGQTAMMQFLKGQKLPLSPEVLKLTQVILGEDLGPNYFYDQRLTQQARAERARFVSPIYDKVKTGEPIVVRNQLVDDRTDAILSSLRREQESRFGRENRLLSYVSQFLATLLITLLLLVYLNQNQPRIYYNNTKLSLILTILLLTVIMMVVASKLNEVAARLSEILGPNINLTYIYLAPACIVPIFLSNFFDFRTGFLCNLVVALYGAVLIQQGLEYVFVQTLAGTVALYSLRRIRERARFFYTLGYIFLAYCISFTVFSMLSKSTFLGFDYSTLLLFAINVIITVIAYNLIFLFEQLFGITSDLTYLELLDHNHPLLKELSRKAPGTFQHSLQVANIAEATIEAIGGNGLLTHVGAMYHDIGKMANQRYFIENMSEEEMANTPHKKLSCEESANIIIGHVSQGIELANKYHLPKEITQFIESHHGTTRVEFFYRQYLAENHCVEPIGEDKFRYPGPKPFSKETAVLMVSDSIEAASRSQKNPTPASLKKLVNGIIDHKIKDNQLENSNLTFKDISIIR